jgi:hypothetical protein
MAEFKLGRIRFVWKGTWDTSATYYKDDVVRYGGKTYICAVGHTSAADFNTDLEFSPTRWNQMTDGQEWRGDWELAKFYKINDIVKYGALLYICNDSHTSAATASLGLEQDQNKWTLYLQGFDWKDDWATSTRYKKNDLVKYGGYTYVCNTGHTSNAVATSGLEADQGKWDEFNQGIEYKSTWAPSIRYKLNDIVKYGAGLWICTTQHSSASAFTTDAANWDNFVEGLEFENDWNVAVDYQQGDVVRYGGNQYVANANTTGATPTAGGAWDLFSEGFKWQSDWSGATTYKVGEIVRQRGYTYLCIAGNLNAEPPNLTYWERLNSGISWQGEWQNTTAYKLGDAVRFNQNAYICVLAHTSNDDDSTTTGDATRSPVGDTAGTYWNLLSSGSEVSVLTTKGDMVYYGGAGPTRLPIGIEGQVLRVNADSTPEWVSWGAGDYIYYVAPHGTDQPAPISGITLDKPWKTIRYAAEQVDKGVNNPNAQRLLELNRVFIQREVTEWIQYQITNNLAPFTTAFTYDVYKCERDTGLVVDAVINDIAHGGNVKSRGAALAYVNALLDSPGTYVKLSTEKEEDVAAFNYMLTVVSAVLTNTAPAVSYQTLNGDNSTATVSQFIDTTLSAETGVMTEITSLVGIITDAITAGVADDIPARYLPASVINVKAGRYRETLPIIVPAECCILGDEVRSTNAGPAGSLTSIDDAKYSIGALDRLETVVGQIIVGTNVTESSGNTALQSASWPFASADETDYVKQLVRSIGTNIDFRLGTMHKATYTDPTGYNSSYLSGYGDARTLLKENKKFLQEEVVAYITNTFPTVLYSRTTCKRDVGYIVDAMIYDLTYGGYSQTLNAGLAYYDGAGGNYVINEAEIQATLSSYTRLKSLMQSVVQNTAISNLQSDIPQWRDTTLTGGSSASSFIGANMDIIYNLIEGDSTAGTPPLVTITTIATNLCTTSVDHGLQAGDTITPRTTEKGFIAGTKYYIKTAPANNTFTVSTSYAGSTQTLTDGTSLDIVADKVDNPAATNGVTTTTALITAFTTLSAQVPTIKTSTIDYINSTFGTFTYDSAKCRRDTGTILDGAYYDIAFGTNYNAVINGRAYRRGYAQEVIARQLTETLGALNYTKTQVADSVASDATSVTRGNAYFTEVLDIIENGVDSADALTFTDPGVDANRLYARQQLQVNKAFIQAEIIAWIAVNYPALSYNSATCSRDVGYIVDALSYDVQYGGNTAMRAAAESYFENAVSILPAGQRTQTAAAFGRLATVVGQIVVETGVTKSSGNAATQDTSGTAASATEATTVTNLVNDTVVAVITANSTSANAAASLPSTSWASAGAQTAIAQLATDETDIIIDTLQYISDNYNSFTYNHRKCSRDVGIILDAVGYDFMFNANFQTLKAGYSYLRSSASEVFSLGQKQITRDALEYVRTLAIANVGADATAISRINTLMQLLDDIIYTGANEGDTCASENRMVDYAVLQLERNRDYIVSEINAYIASTYTGTITATDTTTDVLTISSTSWLQRNAAVRFTGNVFGGISTGTTYYVQNVVNSTTFKIATTRNATTPLNLTTVASGSMTVSLYYNSDLCLRDVNRYIDALKWDLKYTSNYKSLLSARYYSNAVLGSLEEDMYYVRNGTGIRNQTLEGLTGDLTSPNAYGTSRVSAGAYVSLDPGWGPDDFRVWVTSRSCYVQNVTTFGNAAIGQKIDGALHAGGNRSIVSNDFTQLISDGIGAWVTNNGRAELVSVFTYYSHIGYLAENGGRIRGANGNNSYGDFGSVAEGFDNSEIPNTAVVDNKFQFDAVVGSVVVDGIQPLCFEFDNAGTDYTEVTWTVSGAGLGATTSQENEFRDDAVFQVRLLDNVNDSTDAPEADGNQGGFGYLTVTGTAQTGGAASITLSAADIQGNNAYTGMKVLVTGGTGSGQFGIVNSFNSGTKIISVVKESTGASGWDHFIPGTTIVSPDSTSTYLIEPRVSFTAPAYSSSARTLSSSLTWVYVDYDQTQKTYIAVSGTTSGAGTGATFDITRKGTKYSIVDIVATGTGYARLDTITILGTSLGGATTANDLTITIVAVNSTNGSIQAIEISGKAPGGNYVALASGTRDLAYSANGTSWTTVTNALPTSTTWAALKSGKLTATENATALVTGRSYTILDNSNTNWTLCGARSNAVGHTFVATGTGTGSGTATPNQDVIVAVASGGQVNAYSRDGGLTWTTGATTNFPSATWVDVEYGNGTWIAIASGTNANSRSTNGGVSWTVNGVMPASTTWTSIAYGKGVWVAIASGGTQAAYSTDAGVSWTTAALPSSSDWEHVAYGNNRFVAVSSTNGTAAAYSLDGITWTASTLPATAQWTSIAYGQGIFLAVSQSTQAASSEDGIVWTSRTTSTAANGFSSVVHGNPNQTTTWVAVQRSTAGTVASSFVLGATAKGRAFIAAEKIFAIRLLEPGSAYTSAPTITITDPNNTYEAPTQVRIGKGAVANPSWTNRASGYESASAVVDTGDGYADFYQSGQYIAVRRLTARPVAGSNIVFGHLPGRTFKLVNVFTFGGSFDGSYTAFFQISPIGLDFEAPEDGTTVTTRIRYSQVRLTGHDFLDIGSGSFNETNYPGGIPDNTPSQANETVEGNGGRVFFTSTDQDGNFRVGDLFTIEQSTGVATLNADAFNIAGLQELSLGQVSLGGGSASITEFSTDPYFTANSDSVVPTQRAIKAYITSQIGGGGASLNVNSVTAGVISIANDTIQNTSGGSIIFKATFDFRGPVNGYPLAWNYFLT